MNTIENAKILVNDYGNALKDYENALINLGQDCAQFVNTVAAFLTLSNRKQLIVGLENVRVKIYSNGNTEGAFNSRKDLQEAILDFTDIVTNEIGEVRDKIKQIVD